MGNYNVACVSVVGDAHDRRSVLLVSSNDNEDSYLSEVLFYDEDAAATTIFAEDVRCTDMWKSKGNRHFLCDTMGVCHWQDRDGAFVSRQVTDKVLYAVWGLNDTTVFAIGEQGTCLRFDGTDWTDMGDGLSGYLHGIGGTSTSNLYVAGDNGFLAHWDGRSWSPVELGTNVDWRAVLVHAPDRLYLCGLGGTFLSYADGAVVFSTEIGTSLLALAQFKGRIYASSAAEGLFRLEDEDLVLFRDTVKAVALSATANRLFAAVGAMGVVYDGAGWKATRYSKP